MSAPSNHPSKRARIDAGSPPPPAHAMPLQLPPLAAAASAGLGPHPAQSSGSHGPSELAARRMSWDLFRANVADPARDGHLVTETVADEMNVPVLAMPDGDSYMRGDYWARTRARPDAQAIQNHMAQYIEWRRKDQRIRAPVTIGYRADGHGTGAFWDHYTVQQMTGRETIASHPSGVEAVLATHVEGAGRGHFYRGALPRGRSSAVGPVTLTDGASDNGLLFIAGGNYGLASELPRRDPTHVPKPGDVVRAEVRERHERTLLGRAQLTGRPVLAVCGGSWRLLEAFGGQTRVLEPRTHQSRQMPYLNTAGTVGGGGNIGEHGVVFEGASMLRSAMRGANPDTPLPQSVNSVHWAAAEESAPGYLANVRQAVAPNRRFEPLLSVTARGVTAQPPYSGLNPQQLAARHAHSVEAFETRHGAPMMGLQWHPEAYNREQPEYAANSRVIGYMAQAGDAFNARRAMTAEFTEVRNHVFHGTQENPPSRLHPSSVTGRLRDQARSGVVR